MTIPHDNSGSMEWTEWIDGCQRCKPGQDIKEGQTVSVFEEVWTPKHSSTCARMY